MANMRKTSLSGKVMNGCIRPPHFPPHCGCPAGVVLSAQGGEHERSEDGGEQDSRGGHE